MSRISDCAKSFRLPIVDSMPDRLARGKRSGIRKTYLHGQWPRCDKSATTGHETQWDDRRLSGEETRTTTRRATRIKCTASDLGSRKNNRFRSVTRDTRTRGDFGSVNGDRRVTGVSRRWNVSIPNFKITWQQTAQSQSAGYIHYQENTWSFVLGSMTTHINCGMQRNIAWHSRSRQSPMPISSRSIIDSEKLHWNYFLPMQLKTRACDQIDNLGSWSRLPHKTKKKRNFQLGIHHAASNVSKLPRRWFEYYSRQSLPIWLLYLYRAGHWNIVCPLNSPTHFINKTYQFSSETQNST